MSVQVAGWRIKGQGSRPSNDGDMMSHRGITEAVDPLNMEVYPLLASQLEHAAERSGAYALVAAVVVEAVHCVMGEVVLDGSTRHPAETRARHAREAREWFASERRSPMSFLYCCLVLDISPSWVRKGVTALVSQRKTRPRLGHRRRLRRLIHHAVGITRKAG